MKLRCSRCARPVIVRGEERRGEERRGEECTGGPVAPGSRAARPTTIGVRTSGQPMGRARDLPEAARRATSRRPTSRISAAPFTSAVVVTRGTARRCEAPENRWHARVRGLNPLSSTTSSRVRCARCVPAASTEVIGWQRSCRPAGQRVSERLKDISEPGRVTSLLAAGRSRHEGSHPRDHRWLVSTPKIVRWPRATA